MSETHAELVARAAGGDPEAFGLLAEAARPWLLGLCRRLVQDQNAAEDLVQETLFLAFRDLPALRDPACFGAWLTQVARHACYGYLRRRQTHPEDLASAEATPWPEGPAPLLHLHEALARLGPRDQRLLSLYYGEGKALSQAASQLSLSSAAAKVGLHRARRRLRKEMLAMMSEDEKRRVAPEEAAWELRTVLLVEPEEAVRETLRVALTGAGYDVVLLPTGEAALEAVSQRRGQMLLLDKHCLEPHWLEVMALVLVDEWAAKNVPIGVFIDGNERDVLMAWQAGAAFCLTHPYSPGEVVRYLQGIEQTWSGVVSRAAPHLTRWREAMSHLGEG